MKDFFLVRLLRYVIGRFDGKKTIIGFILEICASTIGFIRILYPELTFTIPSDIEETLHNYGKAFLGIGIGHKVQKVIKNGHK